MGRPKLGKHGARAVTVTVEKSLLKQADAYAKANGMKRSELFATSVAEKIGARSIQPTATSYIGSPRLAHLEL
jgi:metal-responsive CopG/Arc/MetJ family transcriptional regulator